MCVGSGVGVERQEEATENLGPAAMTRRWWCRWRPGLDLGVIFLISFLFMHLFVAVLGNCDRGKSVGLHMLQGLGSLRTVLLTLNFFFHITRDFSRIQNPSSRGTCCAKNNFYNL